MGSEISFYVSIFLRRFHYFALVAAVISAAGIATAYLLPTKFQADAVLLLEPPQIPQSLASSTIQTSPQEQLQIMQQKLMTRANLLEIASNHGVFDNRDRMFPDEIVEEMRNSTTFNISVGQQRASVVNIAFEADRPQVVAAVVNDYVTRLLESSAELRQGAAEATLQYFEAEKDRLSADLAEKNAEILRFNSENIDALPQNFSYNLNRMDTLRQRIEAIDRQIVGLEQQRERLILVFNVTGGATGPGQPQNISPERQQLNTLNQQLASIVAVYAEDSPRVKSLRARIAQLEEVVARETPDDPADPGSDPNLTMLDVQLDQVDSQIEDLETEKAQTLDEIARLDVILEQTPKNQIVLDTLTRDYQNIQGQYNTVVDRLAVAATGERIELLAKGERITVINPPVAPRAPSSPNRPMIAIGGVLAGIAMGLAAVLGLELLNRSIRRPADLSRALGIVPIATLPVMRTPGEVARKRAVLAGVIVTSTAGIVAGIVFLHTQIMPLDLMVDLAVKRLGG